MSDIVRAGKLVTLTYSIRELGGEVLEQSDLPVSYVQGGHNELIGGMDRAVEGKRAGDQVELTLTPEQSGFGPHDPALTFTDDLDKVPPQFRHLGAEVQMQNESGDVRTFHVTRIGDGKLTVDGNHPLAGKDLLVTIRINEVRDPTAEERLQDQQSKQAPTLH
ncbi:peptidylprolyl isomerase [Thiohalocapsa marina]|uniref:Peptidyl-prolyl cis-trans isomerase n=1 Tax=Thiohalocapsa marina TaxID=424902 RepID=A0A5M8FQC7_9GAMM|nr:FKBP-type peptidyl-prolyl cis-trans isomerase [Thiohalocapsa marina]KAA6185956.1 peptidylprolyl isomerase [Thiohalocapsa marina]